MRLFFASALVTGFAISLAPPAWADCASDIVSLLKKLPEFGPYKVESTTTSGGNSFTMTGNVKLPDSMDMTMPQGRMILTADGAWMQQNGAWISMPADMTKMVRDGMAQGMAQGIENITNAQCPGQQDFEGKSYTAYAYDVSGEMMGIKSTGSVQLFANEDGSPAVMKILGEAMGTKSETVQHYNYDPSIVIKAPQ